MRETYSTIRHLLHLATELDRACALFLSTHVSITHDEARVLLELGAAQHLLRPGALAKQLNLQPSTLSRVLRNLENRGFIERHRTTEDARSLSLSLTYLGARTAKETEQTLDRFFDGLGKHLGYDDLDGLLNAFQDATDYLSSCCPSCETPSQEKTRPFPSSGKENLGATFVCASCFMRQADERSSEEDVENSERRLFHVKHKS